MSLPLRPMGIGPRASPGWCSVAGAARQARTLLIPDALEHHVRRSVGDSRLKLVLLPATFCRSHDSRLAQALLC